MVNRADWIAGGLGGAMLLAAVAVFGVTHYQVLLHPGAIRAASANAPDGGSGITFPSVEQMCKATGVGGADMQGCISDETSAAEFVGAWLDLNGFLVGGRIDLEQIQLSAQLDAADPGLDAQGAADPLSPPDLPEATGLTADPSDPLADSAPGDNPSSPAQIALYCLSSASDDWLKMHDCISQNDPSSSLGAN
jgi:hypothetical protein